MDAQRWQRLSPLLDELFELEPQARQRRLAELRVGDPVLAAELLALIALEEERGDFLAEPLVSPLAGAHPGSEIGPYRLERMLGEGGMGQVWMAARADGLYERRVALKLLRPGLADTNLRLRFTRERQILARLAHPNIARLLDAGISDGLPYLALEFVDGEAITDYCRERATPLQARLHMFRQICDAVSHAHANLIVHRDLKPSNIMVTPAGEVRLLDFGIAKLLDGDLQAPEQTRTGVRAFTLHYAAPEQIRGEPVTTMTDVYSLGVVLYELLTDRKPYRLKRDSDAAWEEAILTADPLRPSHAVLRTGEAGSATTPASRRHAHELAGDLDNIVLKTLSKRPEQRYPSVEALSLDLQRYATGRPVHARAQSVNYRLRKYLRRHRWAVTAGLLATLVLSTALSIMAWQAREAVREASRAQAMQNFVIGLFENAGGARDGQTMDLPRLLDGAVARGDRELARQPRARAELLGVIARVRIGLGDYREAAALLDRQALIIGLTPGVPRSLQLESLTQQGQVQRLLGQHHRCVDSMQPAVPQVRREHAQLPTQVAEFYSQLGRCLRLSGERQSARRLFERSLALRRELGDDGIGEVESQMDLAALEADAGNLQQSLQAFEAAQERLRGVAGDRHPLLIEIRRSLGSLRRAQGDHTRSEQELKGALDIALEALGERHPNTLAVRRQLAALFVEQGRFSQAETEFRETHRLLAQRLGPEHNELAGSYNSLGLVAWERGDLPAALESLVQGLELSRRAGGVALTSQMLFNLGMVLHAVPRDGEAMALLNESLALRRERFGPDHPLVGDTERLLGEVEIALGLRTSGLARVKRAAALTHAGYGASHPGTLRSELTLAYEQGREGDVSALARLDAMAPLDAPAQPRLDLELRQVRWLAQARAAQLRCNGAERPHGVAVLEQLRTRLAAALPEGGALVREVEALRGACQTPALQAGPALASAPGG